MDNLGFDARTGIIVIGHNAQPYKNSITIRDGIFSQPYRAQILQAVRQETRQAPLSLLS